MSWSFNTSHAKEIVEMGVFSSWVILLMKSFLITASFFCLTTVAKVIQKATKIARMNIDERAIAGPTKPNKYPLSFGK